MMALHLGKLSKNAALNRLIRKIIWASALNVKVVLCWVLEHTSIRGNEIADPYAPVAALRTGVDEPLVPYLDMKPVIRRRLRELWQQEWNKESHNKLHIMKPYIGKYLTKKNKIDS